MRDIATRGEVVATLRASEATIYGRYGYGVASCFQTVEVQTARAAFRPGVGVGGPVRLLDEAQAWDTLPDSLRARVEGRSAVHVTGPEGFGERRRAALDGDVLNNIRETTPSHTTLVGHSHPRTGRTLLYVSQGMTKEIVGLSEDESEDLLEELFAHLYRQDNVIEHHWHNGDLVIWDNLALQHARAAVAAGGPPRTLRKIGSPIPAPSKADELTYQSLG